MPSTFDVHNEAMLVHLRIGYWSASKKDTDAADAAAKARGAKDGAGRYTKFLVNRDAIKPVSSIVAASRKEHYKLTLPFSYGDNVRMLTVPMYERHEAAMQECSESFIAARREFIAEYDSHVDEARDRLGRMFDENQYPPKAMLADSFHFDWQISPLPRGEDLTVNISQERLNEIQADMKASVEASLKSAMMDVYRRLGDTIAKLVERLQGTDKNGNPLTFRDSTITNLAEVVDMVPAFNVTGDAQLAKLAEDCRTKLLIAKPDELRATHWRFDAKKHKSVVRDAKALQRQFAGYFGEAA